MLSPEVLLLCLLAPGPVMVGALAILRKIDHKPAMTFTLMDALLKDLCVLLVTHQALIFIVAIADLGLIGSSFPGLSGLS